MKTAVLEGVAAMSELGKLYREWVDKRRHHDSLPNDSPQKYGAYLNAMYARSTWEKAVLTVAEIEARLLEGMP